ncbi:phosphoribosylamine--glycine ligase [bacterium]|nr:phosphoribosylamine--glycine ligase [bacterium]
MKILVIGGGGREHALVWKLKSSEYVSDIYVAPGNAGIATLAECIDIPMNDFHGLVKFAEKKGIDLTIVGPEQPLADGVVNYFMDRHLDIFGPTQEAAQIESSKIFAKDFMKKYHIPTASYCTFDNADAALKFVNEHEPPLVIKTDGLASGKGSIIANSKDEARDTVGKMMIERAWGEAGRRVLIEEYLEGPEVSILGFTDGKTVIPMIPVQDYKRIYNDGQGPNTGGMGALGPVPTINERMMKNIISLVMQPTVDGLREMGYVFRGILYAGLMLTDRGPKVLEFNCRFGDPETQVLMPMLDSDLAEIMLYVINERLDEADILWKKNKKCVCVVMASGGYPKRYKKGFPIEGLESNRIPRETYIFHAGTATRGNKVVTDGGRVLGVTALGDSFEKAVNKAYQAVDEVTFEKASYRTDIGQQYLTMINIDDE